MHGFTDAQGTLQEFECPTNVIPAYFGDGVYDDVYNHIKFGGGVLKAELHFINEQFHPSFVKAVIKKIMRERGW